MPLFPDMPLAELLSQLTDEEHREVRTVFHIVTKQEGGRFPGPQEHLERLQRHLIGMALYGYADRLHAFAETKLRRQEREGVEELQKALAAYIKARAADASQPVYLFGLARCLESAERAQEAVVSYQAFIREQARFADDPSGQALIATAQENLSRLRQRLE